MRLVFDAPEGHELIVDGEKIAAGEGFDVPDEDRALELLTDPSLSVREAVPSNLSQLKREQLDELALGAGLDPNDFDTKQGVIDALKQSEPEADEAGHEPDKED